MDLIAASGTVWHKGLEPKLLLVISDRQVVSLIMNMICDRTCHLYTSSGDCSRMKSLQNGIPQGSLQLLSLYIGLQTGRCFGDTMNRFRFKENPTCSCGSTQTADHIIMDFPDNSNLKGHGLLRSIDDAWWDHQMARQHINILAIGLLIRTKKLAKNISVTSKKYQHHYQKIILLHVCMQFYIMWYTNPIKAQHFMKISTR